MAFSFLEQSRALEWEERKERERLAKIYPERPFEEARELERRGY